MTEDKDNPVTDQTTPPEKSLPAGPPGLPRWVKALAVAVILLVAVVVGVMVFGGHSPGGHGPGRHSGAAPW